MKTAATLAVGVLAVAALVLPGSASAARAQIDRIPCLVEVPSVGLVPGTAQNVATPSGNVNFTCHATLPAPAPKATQQRVGPCLLVVANRQVTLTCHFRAA